MKSTVPTPEFLSQAGVGRACAVSNVTVWRWLQLGKLKPVAYVDGRVPLFDPAQAAELAARRKNQHASRQPVP